jgi:tight adherence protein B
MDLTVVTVICFVAFAAIAGAAALVLRDLGGAPQTVALDQLRAQRGGAAFRRPRTIYDQDPAADLSGRIDQAFEQLVLECGLNWEPLTAVLVIATAGSLVGGPILLYWDNFLGAVGGALAAMFATLVLLQIRRLRRMNEIREQIPTAFDLLARCVRAGASLEQAIEVVGQETAGPLGSEFTWCARQMSLGMSLPAILRLFSNRLRLVEIRILTSTLLIHRQTGGNLPQTLNRMAAVVRDRLNARRQLRASTAAGRASAIFIASLTPVLYVVMFIWQEEHFRILWEDPIGRMLLGVAITLEVIGVLWVINLLKAD